jgi:hypothetical protein
MCINAECFWSLYSCVSVDFHAGPAHKGRDDNKYIVCRRIPQISFHQSFNHDPLRDVIIKSIGDGLANNIGLPAGSPVT